MTPGAAGSARASELRDRMVLEQLERPRDDRQPIRCPRVLAAMRKVPRHRFVPDASLEAAYGDSPLEIGHAQTISQPYMVALMVEALDVHPDSHVLDVGSGCGYAAAVLAELAREVTTLEVIPALARRAAATLVELGYARVDARCGDANHGCPERAPFDRIVLACATPALPPALRDQLVPGGLCIYPRGHALDIQELIVVTKGHEGHEDEERRITLCRFVPLTRPK